MDEATVLTGVGLRQPHLAYFDQYRPKLGWLEIHSENYFRPHRPAFSTLMRLREDYAISCHGVGLSLGSDEPLDRVEDHRHLADRQEMLIGDGRARMQPGAGTTGQDHTDTGS